MAKFHEKKVYRVLDANFNRAAEGMRVCEEVLRFILNDEKLTGQFKDIRHKLFKASGSILREEFTKRRDSRNDVGRNLLKGELERRDWRDIFFANMQRVKESLRVLEEFFKLIDKNSAIKLKKLRFQVYETEKKIALRFPALSTAGQKLLQKKRCR